MPVFQISPELEPLARMMQAGVERLPEGTLLQIALASTARRERLTEEQIAALGGGFREVYASIAADPAFTAVASALSQAVSRDLQRPGHYFLYRPPEVTAQTPSIVFLHGFGGNFQFYMYLLKSAFPDHIVICPSYGMFWHRSGLQFLDEVLTDAERRLQLNLVRPWLMSISAGGPASFAFYNAAPDRYRGLICIATCPAPADVRQAQADLVLLMLNGVQDDRYPVELARLVLEPLRDRVKTLELRELPEADHFFILTRSQETFDIIKDFIARHHR